MAMLLIQVKAPEAGGKENSSYLDFDFVRSTSSLLQHVQQLGWDLLPGAPEIKATYMDDEGDACTLTNKTANDALSCATLQGADDTRILNISVCGVRPQEKVLVQPSHANAETHDEASSEDAKKQAEQEEAGEAKLGKHENARKELEQANHLAQQLAEENAWHKRDAKLEKERHRRREEQFAEDTLSCKAEVEEAKQQLQEARNARKGIEEANQHVLEACHIARKEERSRCKSEAVEEGRQLQNAMNARREAEESLREALRSVGDLRQHVVEETSNRQEAELANEQAQQALTDSLQRIEALHVELAAALKRTVEAEQSAHDAQSLNAKLTIDLKLAEEAEQIAHEMQQKHTKVGPSAFVQSCCPLTLGARSSSPKPNLAGAWRVRLTIGWRGATRNRNHGVVRHLPVQNCSEPGAQGWIEAEEDAIELGDTTNSMIELVTSCNARQAFCVGRVHLPVATKATSVPAPACARVTVQNDGPASWPQTTAVVNVGGPDMGLPIKALGALEPGEVVEIEMDLVVCSTPEADSETRSLWSIMDAATGARFGPLLVFEAAWCLT